MSYEKATNVMKKIGGGGRFSCFCSFARDHLPHGVISTLAVFTTVLRE